MKTMKIICLLFSLTMILTTASCSKDYLDVDLEGSNLSEGFISNEETAFSAVVAVYDVLRKNSGGFENLITMMNAGSDDHFAGGGGPSDGVGIQSFSNYVQSATTIPPSFWNDHYQGVFRANFLLEQLPVVDISDASKVRFTAETKTLRALYYFNLVRMFKNIPLITTPIGIADIPNVLQADPNEVYALIESDLLAAIPDLPQSVSGTEAGRMTEGAARALLGKVYLFEGKMGLAAEQLAAVNGTPGTTSQFGYSLLENFEDLWAVGNKFNSESIIEVAHTNKSNASWEFWGSGRDEGNSVNVMVGPRGYSKIGDNAPDLPSGWSFNVFTQDFYDFIKNDPRYEATVLNLNALKQAGEVDYISGHQDTGFFLNKFVPRRSDVTTGAGVPELNYKQNTYVIRLADTYLMEAEALGGSGARAQALLDAVRARVGLPSVPVSQTAIMNERRAELAGEGHRWFDLVRTGQATSILASRGFTPGRDEIFPIPFKELENTNLVQNPNYN
ncbi:MAG: RagB/SusD family nutrient uptake outer membrane protein [Flavobacteriaceae bacterium]|nr:RagB/SusD family nutrient uptake outer membrane protein [Flavobacteriaceae bacterium]